MDPLQAFADYEAAALAAIAGAADEPALEAARIRYFGKKSGQLRDLQKLVGKVPVEQKPAVGKAFNDLKQLVSNALVERTTAIVQHGGDATGVRLSGAAAIRVKSALIAHPTITRPGSALDVTLPGNPFEPGRLHPITQTMREFKDIVGRFGFTAVEGPEVEDERHNFVALNIPDEHPARDPLDNFYLAAAQSAAGKDGPRLLRSQTSTVQIREMEKTPPPIRIVSLGRVYRPDTIDATHHCMFHQMEGLMVGPDVTMAQLKTVLYVFAKAYLGDDVDVRFRPSFFPFTEPSVEVDMLWGDDWIEVGGAGMVDPNVFEAVGYNPEEVQGFAFGLGIERFCMRRHEITDIRTLHENDVRFLRQF